MANGPDSVFASGAAHHKFIQLVALQRTETLESLKAEAERLQSEHALTAEEVAFLDFDALAAFWQSNLGNRIRAQSASVHSELPFTARFSHDELSAAEISFSTPPNPDQPNLAHSAPRAPHTGLAEEFIVVQGVADLVVLLAKEIWIVDFKTDAVRGKQLDERAKSYEIQMKLYARALARIYNRPVSQCWLYFLSVGRALPLRGE